MKILFFTHDLHRAGAQIYLLRFLKWLKKNKPHITLHVISFGKGKLKKDFELYVPVSMWKETKKHLFITKTSELNLQAFLDSFQPDVVYNNTWMNGIKINSISFSCPVITHVHELDHWIDLGGKQNSLANIKKTTKFFTDSQSVANNLNKRFNIPTSICTPVYLAFDEIDKISFKYSKLKDYLKLPKGSFIVGACGVESYRKGKDFFIKLAEQVILNVRKQNVHFVWIGGELEPEIENDYNKSEFKSSIHFVPTIPDAHHFFSDFDIFCMISRDDPFPTVNLEAGASGVPIICFKDSGGTEELVKKDGGFAIENMDLNKFAKACIELCNNNKLIIEMGKTLQNRVIENFNLHSIASNVYTKLEQIVNESKSN